MQIIKIGTEYKIYDNSINTCDKLPAGFYTVNFHPMNGWSLVETDPITINEKIYGKTTDKVAKVMNSFNRFDRNLGVILSGDKGIGKSLFAKSLAIKMCGDGYPVILVNKYIDGIASFIGTIQQECCVMFDEFDKTFAHNDDRDPQTEMLTLFDGFTMGKKLFVITCNDYKALNEFIVNRPGRFHYHFRFDYPNDTEITEYLQDNMSEEYYDEIPAVIDFSRKVPLNYDCLRSIAFELESGEHFSEVVKDLNIVRAETPSYDLKLYFANGEIIRLGTRCVNMFSNEDVCIEIPSPGWRCGVIRYIPSDAEYNPLAGMTMIPGKNLEIDWRFEDCTISENDDDDDRLDKKRVAELRESEIIGLGFKYRSGSDIHYMV